jgi:hypothetical protein
LRALTRGPESGYPTGLDGTIYLAQTEGIGVQNQNGDGSGDVSGWGKDKYESLIFEFSAPVDAQQVSLWMRNEFTEPGVELWVAPFSGTVIQVPNSSVWEFRHMTDAYEGYVNLWELPEMSDVGSIVSIIVRTSRKVHFFVNRIAFELSADNDNDGFPADYDCDDTDPSVYPGAPEVSNGIDDDCDGDVDEDFDADGDGVSDYLDNCPEVANPNQTDSDQDNFGAACDCNDSNAGVNPGETEVCNGIDDNCDGSVDEDVVMETFYRDQDGDGYGNPNVSTEACSQPEGYVTDHADCNDSSASVNPGATETCNSVDDDCDGSVDEGFDSDGDGYTSCGGDCNDSNASVNPGEAELCNGIDDNCDGNVDEDVPTETFYQDQDGDGYGNPSVSTEACSQPEGYVTDNTDCNDSFENIHPGMTETCNYLDDDCDGAVDELFIYYIDSDGDGFGNPDLTVPNNPVRSCYGQPDGWASNDADCDDSDPNINPGAPEVCNGLDDNCDENVDEVQCTLYYLDADGDTYGDAENATEATSQPAGYVANASDCDDTNAGVNPGVAETCNEVDDDCNGQVDDGLTMYTFYYDADGDGYGNPDNSIEVCDPDPPSGYVTNNLDCGADSSANVHPGADEVCYDLVDNDCNGFADWSDPACQP